MNTTATLLLLVSFFICFLHTNATEYGVGSNYPKEPIFNTLPALVVEPYPTVQGVDFYFRNILEPRNNSAVVMNAYLYASEMPLNYLCDDPFSTCTTCKESSTSKYKLNDCNREQYFTNTKYTYKHSTKPGDQYYQMDIKGSFTLLDFERSKYVDKKPNPACKSGTIYSGSIYLTYIVPDIVRAFRNIPYNFKVFTCNIADEKINGTTVDSIEVSSVKNNVLYIDTVIATKRGDGIKNPKMDPSTGLIVTAQSIDSNGISKIITMKTEKVYNSEPKLQPVKFNADYCRGVKGTDWSCIETQKYTRNSQVQYSTASVDVNPSSPRNIQLFCSENAGEIYGKDCHYPVIGKGDLYVVAVLPQLRSIFHFISAETELMIAREGVFKHEAWEANDTENFYTAETLPAGIDPKILQLAKDQLVYVQRIKATNHTTHLVADGNVFTLNLHAEYAVNAAAMNANENSFEPIASSTQIVRFMDAQELPGDRFPLWATIALSSAGLIALVAVVAVTTLLLVRAIVNKRKVQYEQF